MFLFSRNSQRELFYKYLYQYVIYRLDFEENIALGVGNETRLGAIQIAKKREQNSPLLIMLILYLPLSILWNT